MDTRSILLAIAPIFLLLAALLLCVPASELGPTPRRPVGYYRGIGLLFLSVGLGCVVFFFVQPTPAEVEAAINEFFARDAGEIVEFRFISPDPEMLRRSPRHPFLSALPPLTDRDKVRGIWEAIQRIFQQKIRSSAQSSLWPQPNRRALPSRLAEGVGAWSVLLCL